MAKVKPELFKVLNDPKTEAVLSELYTAAMKQIWPVMFHLLPKAYKLLGKGAEWSEGDEQYYSDKYIPIEPNQGTFIYMQARAVNAKYIVEFGTSYGISTLYLGKAAKDNGGQVITSEYLPQKVIAAKQSFVKAGLSDYIEVLEGDALQTLKSIEDGVDFVLLDGWPNLVFDIFKILEPKLKPGAIIIVDDVEGFTPAMQDYLNYIREPTNGYLSTIIRPSKGMEFSIKLSLPATRV